METGPAAASGFDMNRPTIIALLYLGGFLTGVSVVIGLILAYVWRSEPHEDWEGNLYRFLIRTFWMGIAWAIVAGIGAVATLGLLAFVLLPLVSVWFLIRVVKALLAAQKRQPVANVETWLF